MKKLLALSIALLSLNLYGADEPTYSERGLEGFGQKDILGNTGIKIAVFIHEKADQQPFHDKDLYDKQHIIDTVELALRRAGIKVNENSLHRIHISATPKFIGGGKVVDGKRVGKLERHELRMSLKRHLQFKHNGKTYEYYAGLSGPEIVWNDYKVSNPALDADLQPLKIFVDMQVSFIKRANKKEPKEIAPPKKP